MQAYDRIRCFLQGDVVPFLFRPFGAPMYYGMISTGDHGHFYPLREHSPGGSGGCCRTIAKPGGAKNGTPIL